MINTLGDLITAAIIIAALLVVPYKIVKAWVWPIVKQFFVSTPTVMSRSVEIDQPIAVSAHRQTEAQTDQAVSWPILPRDEILDICKTLRRHGFTREEARQLLRALHQPLDNNLWTQAAPPDDDTHITPIAGRPTRAQFESDPDLVYQPPS